MAYMPERFAKDWARQAYPLFGTSKPLCIGQELLGHWYGRYDRHRAPRAMGSIVATRCRDD